MSPKRRGLIALVLVTMVLLAGCAGVGGDGDAGAQESNGPQYAASTDAARDAGSGASDGGAWTGDTQLSMDAQATDSADDGGSVPVDDQGRAIVREGTMTLEVDNYSAARSAIAARADSLGGYVSGSNQRLHRDGDRTRRSGHVVVRVPASEYQRTVNDTAALGTVVSQRTETTDVTDQLVDLEARLENLEQRRDRLRTFYERANDTEELLAIESELSNVQGEIERLEAKQRSLEQRVAYSTLRVEINEPEPTGGVQTQYHERSLAGAFLGSVLDVYDFGRATLVTAAATAPWLAVLAVPFGVARLAYRRGAFPSVGGSSEPTEEESPTDPVEEDDGDH